jgi:Zn-dependent protease
MWHLLDATQLYHRKGGFASCSKVDEKVIQYSSYTEYAAKRKGNNVQRFFKGPVLILFILLFVMGPLQAFIGGGTRQVSQWILDTLLLLPAVVIALSFHEFAHAKVAQLAGDPTPGNMGRVTIDPRAHIDPMGMIALILVRFGWGKPVQVNPANFGNRRRDSILVGLSGVTANLLLAVLFGGIIFLSVKFAPDFFQSGFGGLVGVILIQVVIINITLMLFNLLPIPPLDGFGVLSDIFNLHGTPFYAFVYQNSFLILMVAIILGLPGKLLSGPLLYIVDWIMGGIYGVSGWWLLLS